MSNCSAIWFSLFCTYIYIIFLCFSIPVFFFSILYFKEGLKRYIMRPIIIAKFIYLIEAWKDIVCTITVAAVSFPAPQKSYCRVADEALFGTKTLSQDTEISDFCGSMNHAVRKRKSLQFLVARRAPDWGRCPAARLPSAERIMNDWRRLALAFLLSFSHRSLCIVQLGMDPDLTGAFGWLQ